MNLFYYLRHGQTDPNLQDITCGGDWDVSLNDYGISQARKAADLIYKAKTGIKTILVSPMKRTLETAAIVGHKINVPVVPIEGLEERHIGDWEGVVWSTIKDDFLNGVTPPLGESRTIFRERVNRAIQKVKSHPSPFLVVSHGAVWMELCILLGMSECLINNCEPIKVFTDHKQASKLWMWERLSF